VRIDKWNQHHSFYVVALGCGLRRGELLALTRDCVDLDAGLIHVKKTLQSIKGKGLVLGEPKSASSRRTIAMPDFIKDTLSKQNRVVESPFEALLPALVAQRIRALACGARGRVFESRRGRLNMAVQDE